MSISVVMAIYNGESFIKEQLDSLLNQTKKPDEVLIFDDCSIDLSISLVNEFISSNHLENWELIENKSNLGFRENFRRGLLKSKGDIVFLCDQDDIWYENKIEKMNDILENEKILSLASSFVLINEIGDEIKDDLIKGKSNHNLLNKEVGTKELIEIPYKYLLKENFAQGCTMAVKREIINLFALDKTSVIEHDWSLSLIASLKDGCYFYNEALIKYRLHGKNAIGLIENKDNDYRNTRMLNREKAIQMEKDRLEFVLQYQTLNSQNSLNLKTYMEYYTDRLNAYKKRKSLTFMILCVFNKYHKICDYHSLLGDVLSNFKNKY